MAPAKTKKVVLTVKKPRNTRAKHPTRNTPSINNHAGPAEQDTGLSRDAGGTGPGTQATLPPELMLSNDAVNPSATRTTAELEKEVTGIRAALENERIQNAELRKRIEDMGSTSNDVSENTAVRPIPRPRGTAGTNFSIQEAMGLAGSTKKYETYKALQRNLRDLSMNARINWEVPWAQVPARDKAKLFEVARDQHPFLARFERDWATEEIVKQFMKNKRKNHYANGWLEVPAQYAYLKQNSMKRNPTASRVKRVHAGSVDSRRDSNAHAGSSAASTARTRGEGE